MEARVAELRNNNDRLISIFALTNDIVGQTLSKGMTELTL